jgi:hypothetical protein
MLWRSRIVGPLREIANLLSRKAHVGSNPTSSAFENFSVLMLGFSNIEVGKRTHSGFVYSANEVHYTISERNISTSPWRCRIVD